MEHAEHRIGVADLGQAALRRRESHGRAQDVARRAGPIRRDIPVHRVGIARQRCRDAEISLRSLEVVAARHRIEDRRGFRVQLRRREREPGQRSHYRRAEMTYGADIVAFERVQSRPQGVDRAADCAQNRRIG